MSSSQLNSKKWWFHSLNNWPNASPVHTFKFVDHFSLAHTRARRSMNRWPNVLSTIGTTNTSWACWRKTLPSSSRSCFPPCIKTPKLTGTSSSLSSSPLHSTFSVCSERSTDWSTMPWNCSWRWIINCSTSVRRNTKPRNRKRKRNCASEIRHGWRSNRKHDRIRV